MTSGKQKSSPRKITPYKDLSPIDELFNKDVALYADGVLVETDILRIDRDYPSVYKVTYSYTAKKLFALLKTAYVDPEYASLVVVARSNTFKKSKIMLNKLVSDLDGDVLELLLSGDAKAGSDLIFNDLNGFQLTIALVLNQTIQNQELFYPYLVGTYLAKKNYSVKKDYQVSSFVPKILTKEVRKALNLPKNSATYINIRGSLLDADNLFGVTDLYIDETMLKKIGIVKDNEVAIKYQVDYAILILETILTSLLQEMVAGDLEFNDIEKDSGAYTFISSLRDKLNLDLPDLIDTYKNDRPRLRSLLEHMFDSLNHNIKVLEKAYREEEVNA